MDLGLGLALVIGVSGVVVAFVAYAVVRGGARKSSPMSPRSRSPLDWRAGDPYRPRPWRDEEPFDE